MLKTKGMERPTLWFIFWGAFTLTISATRKYWSVLTSTLASLALQKKPIRSRKKIHKEPWSSYFQIIPKGLDVEAKRDYVPSFSEVFAQRGDQTPIAYCNTHRSGCPDTNNESYRLAPSYHYFAHYCSRKYPLYRPDAPVIVLRWGGSVSFVYKGGASLGTYQVLMDY